jgi:hypothetical protein
LVGLCGLAGVRIDDIVSEEFAGLVDYGDLAPGPQAGIDAQNGDRAGGRRQQQVIKVVAKDLDGVEIGALLEFEPKLALDAGGEQATPRVFDGKFELRSPIAVAVEDVPTQDTCLGQPDSVLLGSWSWFSIQFHCPGEAVGFLL